MIFLELVKILAALAPEIIKAWREHEAAKGSPLTKAETKAVGAAIVKAVKTKDTSELEALLATGHRPASDPEVAP